MIVFTVSEGDNRDGRTKVEKTIAMVTEAIRNGEHSRAELMGNESLGTPAEVREALMRMHLRGLTKVWDDGRMVDLV